MSELKTTQYMAIQTLIHLASAGARKECVNDLNVDWNAVIPLAVEQHVLSLVACALLHSPELKCPAELRESLLNIMRTEASANLIRRQCIMKLLDEMHQVGIEAKVLKGYAVAECYAHPECRDAVDTDLLIDKKQEKKAIAFFESKGFRVDPRAATSHHTVCQHNKYGVVELHVSLHAELMQEGWYQGLSDVELVQEDPVTLRVSDSSFLTLGYTDQLIFLTMHMAKHFILGGLTLKMMLDIALYFSCHRNSIDAVRYWSVLEKLHYHKLISSILWNMIHTNAFCAEEFPGLQSANPAQIELILCDLVQGGYMGAKEKDERFESGMEFNHQLMSKKHCHAHYYLHMLNWKIKTGAKYMFPRIKVLNRLYPITEELPILIPILWIWQVISFPVKKVYSGSLARDVRTENTYVSKTAEGRLTMFKELEML